MNNNSEFMPVECLNVPKVLFYDKQYEDLSMDAKLIYALLLDRKEMAIRNEWVDEYGDTYVIYPKQEIKKYLNISRYRIDQALAELEEHDQMVEVAVPYPGKLCQFYVKDITDNEKQMEEDIMKKMKESNGENFCRASGCGYARCFTGISPKYMAKMNKEDRNNFQTAIEEILEDLNLGGHVTAEPLMSERTKEYFDSYKDEAYYSLSPKKRKIVDMQQRGYIDEDGQIDEDAIYDDACEAAEELAVFLRAVFNNPKEDSKKLIKFLDNLWTAGKYKQLQATLIGFELLLNFQKNILKMWNVVLVKQENFFCLPYKNLLYVFIKSSEAKIPKVGRVPLLRRMPGSVYTLPVPAILSSQVLNTKNQRNVYFGCADYC